MIDWDSIPEKDESVWAEDDPEEIESEESKTLTSQQEDFIIESGMELLRGDLE